MPMALVPQVFLFEARAQLWVAAAEQVELEVSLQVLAQQEWVQLVVAQEEGLLFALQAGLERQVPDAVAHTL